MNAKYEMNELKTHRLPCKATGFGIKHTCSYLVVLCSPIFLTLNIFGLFCGCIQFPWQRYIQGVLEIGGITVDPDEPVVVRSPLYLTRLMDILEQTSNE